jgi:hypothetical protein
MDDFNHGTLGELPTPYGGAVAGGATLAAIARTEKPWVTNGPVPAAPAGAAVQMPAPHRWR